MKMKKRFLGILLSLVMVLGLVPGMSLTALARGGDPYAGLLNTTTVVNFDGKEWYLIEDNSTAANAGTVTLLSKECVAASQYDSNMSSNTYSGSTVETAVNNYYTDNISGTAKVAVVDNKMFLLTTAQANAMTNDARICSEASGALATYWWLCSPGESDINAAYVDGDDGSVNDIGFNVYYTFGVRPALKLNLESVTFSSESNTFTVGTAASYTLTIPSALTVANSGWNATDGISASGTLGSGKKLTVTAASANGWALKSDVASVGYTLTTEENGSQTETWEFTALDGAKQGLGIMVEDYSGKPAGEYKDTVTFTAKVESSGVPVTGITLNKSETVISVGSSETLAASVSPDDATDNTVTWISDNPAVAAVDSATGKVTAIATGTAKLRATANDGSGVYGECIAHIVPGLARAFEDGVTTTVTFENMWSYMGDVSITFFNDKGNYRITSFNDPTDSETIVWSLAQVGETISIVYGYSWDEYHDHDVTITLRMDNSYSVSAPDGYFAVSDLKTVVVDGFDIKEVLTKK